MQLQQKLGLVRARKNQACPSLHRCFVTFNSDETKLLIEFDFFSRRYFEAATVCATSHFHQRFLNLDLLRSNRDRNSFISFYQHFVVLISAALWLNYRQKLQRQSWFQIFLKPSVVVVVQSPIEFEFGSSKPT